MESTEWLLCPEAVHEDELQTLSAGLEAAENRNLRLTAMECGSKRCFLYHGDDESLRDEKATSGGYRS